MFFLCDVIYSIHVNITHITLQNFPILGYRENSLYEMSWFLTSYSSFWSFEYGGLFHIYSQVMEGGEIKQAGEYEQILVTGQTFEQLVNAHMEAMTSADPINYPASVGSQWSDIILLGCRLQVH